MSALIAPRFVPEITKVYRLLWRPKDAACYQTVTAEGGELVHVRTGERLHVLTFLWMCVRIVRSRTSSVRSGSSKCTHVAHTTRIFPSHGTDTCFPDSALRWLPSGIARPKVKVQPMCGSIKVPR
jgi:hypothetical protein